MLASTGGVATYEFVIAPLVVAGCIFIVRAVTQTYKKHQVTSRDSESIAEFLFDVPENPRTHTPAKRGWTTQVNETLKEHGGTLHQVSGDVKQILNETRLNAAAAQEDRDRHE